MALVLYFAGVVRSEEVHLLRLALLLLGAMAAIRLFVYVLRRSLPRAAWIATFELAYRAHYLGHHGAVRHWLAR